MAQRIVVQSLLSLYEAQVEAVESKRPHHTDSSLTLAEVFARHQSALDVVQMIDGVMAYEMAASKMAAFPALEAEYAVATVAVVAAAAASAEAVADNVLAEKRVAVEGLGDGSDAGDIEDAAAGDEEGLAAADRGRERVLQSLYGDDAAARAILRELQRAAYGDREV